MPEPPDQGCQPLPNVFQRLKLLHQIDYPTVHVALSYYPQNMLFFAQWFKGRTINQVLQQFEKWDELLAKDFVPALAGELEPKVRQRLRSQLEKWDKFLIKDFILALHVELKSKVQLWLQGQFRQLDKSDKSLAKDLSLALDAELKSEVQQFIRAIGAYVVNALLEANPSVGLWDLKVIMLPTGETAEGEPIYINPSAQIVATHRETNEKRTVPFTDGEMSRSVSACKEAFEKLDFWDSLWKGDPSPKLVSRRATQGWPFFTQSIIPRLYDLLAPHYESRGHHWARHGVAASPRRAEYQQVLLVDMLEILRLEYKAAFEKTTIPQLKSAVQQHLESKKS